MSPNITIKSPTRVDLAGGTLDMWPLYAFVGGATTINVAISLWTECEMGPNPEGVSIVSDDLKKSWTFAGRESLVSSSEPELAFYRTLFEAVPDLDRVSVRTRSQSPVGGGIGGSSSLLISCLKAAHEFTGQILPPVIELTMWAHQLEARMLRTPTGTQDYVPAITGGLNLIHFNDRKVTNEVLPVAGTPLETHFLLVNTGRSHHSGLNNFDVLSRAVNRDEKVFNALKAIQTVSNEFITAIRGRDWSVVPDLFRRELDARLQLTPKFTSPEIEKLHDLSRQEGAEALKICGAGGGGCVMIWVEPKARERVVHACQSAGFHPLNAVPVDPL